MEGSDQTHIAFQKLISEFEKKPIPSFRIFMVSDNRNIVIYTVNSKRDNREYSMVHSVSAGVPITTDRGKILEKSIRIEFLLSQIIFIYMNGKNVNFFDPVFGGMWNDILEKITFAQKIKLLNKWKLKKFDGKTRKHLDTIKYVRNQLAHTLNKGYIYYDFGGNEFRLKDSQEQFGNIVNECWINLLGVYQELWNQKELAEYILNQLMEVRESEKISPN